MNSSVHGKPMIKDRGASDMLKGVGHLLSLIANGVELILIIRIYEKQGIMMLSLKQTKLHWSYDLIWCAWLGKFIFFWQNALKNNILRMERRLAGNMKT